MDNRKEKRRGEGGEHTLLISSSFSSLSMKKVRYSMDTSTAMLAPSLLCSSRVSRPPENAYLLI